MDSWPCGYYNDETLNELKHSTKLKLNDTEAKGERIKWKSSSNLHTSEMTNSRFFVQAKLQDYNADSYGFNG